MKSQHTQGWEIFPTDFIAQANALVADGQRIVERLKAQQK